MRPELQEGYEDPDRAADRILNLIETRVPIPIEARLSLHNWVKGNLLYCYRLVAIKTRNACAAEADKVNPIIRGDLSYARVRDETAKAVKDFNVAKSLGY